MSDLLRIGQLATLAEINASTIRYYEQLGLLDGVDRTEGGSRRYSPDMISRLKVIKGLQAMGFSLADMTTLLKGQAQCENKATILATLSKRAEDMDNLIQTLKQRRKSLIAVHNQLKDTWDEGRCLTQAELEELENLIGMTQ